MSLQNVQDCYAVMMNPMLMERREVAGFQRDFNVNLSADQIDDDCCMDSDFDFESAELTELDCVDMVDDGWFGDGD